MENIKHLDNILTILKGFPEQTPEEVSEFLSSIHQPLDSKYTKLALKKLVKDGYAEEIERINDTNDQYVFYTYKITWEGLTILELGGYAYLHQDFVRSKQEKSQIVILTLILAAGAAIASLYYLFEIVKWYCGY